MYLAQDLMVRLRTCQGPLRKEIVFSAVDTFLKLCVYAGEVGGGIQCCGLFLQFTPYKSREASSEFKGSCW